MCTYDESMALWLVQRRLEDLVDWRTGEQWGPTDEAAYVALCGTEAELLALR
jgi:hypothetical protein